MSGVNRRVGLAKGALDQFDSAVAPLFDRQLEQMGFSESQIEQQDLTQLETTLEMINNAIDNSGSLMKFRLRLTAEAGAVITQGPDYHYEVSILPLLVSRKGMVLERIRTLHSGADSGPSLDPGTPAGSQNIRGGHDAFASGRDFTIINYFGTGQGSAAEAGGTTAEAGGTTADAGAGSNGAGEHTHADPQPAGRTTQPEPEDPELDPDAAQGGKAGTPEVSMEAGIAYARIAAQLGHPPYVVTRGRASPDQPLDYLLDKTAEVVWEAVSSAQSELEPYLVPLRNYLGALIVKIGVMSARDFALGVLTERVRQEEDGWPDQPGDVGGKRSAHGTGTGHLCLLERKHHVETAIFRVPVS